MKLARFSYRVLAFAFIASALTAAEAPMADVIRDSFDFAAAQYTRMLGQLDGKSGNPRTTDNGKVRIVRYTDWTSGFFPGALWYVAEGTGDAKWREPAAKYTALVEESKNNRATHDVGFVLYCSFGNGLRLTGNPHYRDVLLKGAESLSTRFNPTVGAIRSWDARPGWTWKYPVIIDNMMNLELLMWASHAGNNPQFATIAVTHAETTRRNHFRPDNSSFHVVSYDPANGQVERKQTHQGAADDSAWARGQAWGLYGYTMMFRETKKPEFLEQARKIAAFIMNHPRLPADKVPYWDFDAPGIPNAPRDASAAAIMSSALFELSTFVPAEEGAKYRTLAEQQLRSLASPAYRAKLGENGCFLLMHCTGHKPAGTEIDGPLIYGDYYFLEALLRCKAQLPKS